MAIEALSCRLLYERRAAATPRFLDGACPECPKPGRAPDRLLSPAAPTGCARKRRRRVRRPAAERLRHDRALATAPSQALPCRPQGCRPWGDRPRRSLSRHGVSSVAWSVSRCASRPRSASSTSAPAATETPGRVVCGRQSRNRSSRPPGMTPCPSPRTPFVPTARAARW